MFLLRRRGVLAAIALLAVGWAVVCARVTMRDGSSPPVALVCFMAVIAAAASFVLVVGPGFLVYRALFTKRPEIALAPGEQIFATALANHFLDGEGRGGRLFVTEQRLGFLPHRFNLQLTPWSVDWSEIVRVYTKDSLALTIISGVVSGVDGRALQNGIIVELRDGRRERLIAFKREALARSLDRLHRAAAGERAATLAQAREAGELTGLEVATAPATTAVSARS